MSNLTIEFGNIDFTYENIGLIVGLSFSVSLKFDKMKNGLFGFHLRMCLD